MGWYATFKLSEMVFSKLIYNHSLDSELVFTKPNTNFLQSFFAFRVDILITSYGPSLRSELIISKKPMDFLVNLHLRADILKVSYNQS